MPSTLPGSFASAAASASNSSDPSARSSSRAEAGTLSEWPRRANGATQTFRRTSTTNTPSASQPIQRDQPSSTASAGAYVPPHMSASRVSSYMDTRYSKSQLLDLFRIQKDSGDLEDSLANLYVGDSPFETFNGGSASKWSRKDDQKSEYNAPGSDVCWERSGTSEPLHLVDMTEEEKELFSTSVNSPLKAPNQSGNRDSGQRESGVGARKSSVTQSASYAYGLTSPTAPRSSTRRRDTSESYPFGKDSATSPTSAGPSKDDGQDSSPFGFFRRKTDVADAPVDRSIDEELTQDAADGMVTGMSSTFGSLRRSTSNLAAGSSVETISNWPPTTQGSSMSPVGGLGSLGRSTSGLNSVSKRPELGPSRESRFRGLMNIGKTEEEPVENLESAGTKGTEQGPFDSTHASRDLFGGGDATRTTSHHTLSGMSSSQSLAEDSGNQGLSSPGNFSEQLYQQSSIIQPMATSNEPLSPTFTNPYGSPQQQQQQQQQINLHAMGADNFNPGNLHLPGLGGYQARPPRDGPAPTSFAARREMSRTISSDQRPLERAQPFGGSSSTTKGFPSLAGLGGLGGFGSPEPWSAGFGAPQSAREKSSFPEFGAQTSSAQSPGIPGSVSGGGVLGDPGAIGRSSKLGSLFPTAMQEQIRNQAPESNLQSSPEASEDLNRAASARQDLDSPFYQSLGKLDDFSGVSDMPQAYRGNEASAASEQAGYSLGATSQTQNYNMPQQQFSAQHPGQRGLSMSTSASNQPPAAQQKTMVMPDRIRWIYRDPQGNTQGPWSGLEMHDWYRAGFFSPELLVKKVEDADYEPLAQLIRRIGNSREPFLVPQIGIPGPPNAQPGPGWPNQNVLSSPPNNSAAVQPPFAGSFPSFGTTLTAEQQNALERRKQEEQYLMARQKEHLAQQQLHARQMQTQHGMFPQQLQHHASAQSLQSQPSYGSMTSPNGFQQSPPQNVNQLNPHLGGAGGGAFDSPFRLGGGVGIGPIGSGVESMGHAREDSQGGYYSRLGTEQGAAGPASGQYAAMDPQFKDLSLEERTAAMLADRARLERQQADNDRVPELRSQEQTESTVNERLLEFEGLRGEIDGEGASQAQLHGFQDGVGLEDEMIIGDPQDGYISGNRSLSLTEQVQKAAASSKQPPPVSPWAKVDTAIHESAAPHSASPLPAPAARRGRTNVADTLAAESIAQSDSPVEETPTASIAPWAKDSSETTKQPSLREIQEVEAQKAAKQEEMVATARRAALEREMANQPVPAAPGLPSSSTWANAESPLTLSAITPSAWSKPTATKVAAAPTTSTKKTLQQIQAEEEAAARKKKASAASNASIASHIAGQVQSMSSGKRYADLAGKAASSSPSAASGGGAWTTVGASGKAKAPTTPTAPAPATTATTTTATTQRSASGTNLVGATSSATTTARPKPTTSNSKQSLATAKQTAMEELKKWATAELQTDLHKNINVDEFVSTLFSFPVETEIITEVVHQNSTTMDSRHFAEEFARRRNLAEKGKMDATSVSSTTSTTAQQAQGAGADGKSASSGWNEVARKGGATSSSNTEGSGAFKIVTAKKKGKR